MHSGTSNYPWVTIWDIGMTYVGHFGKISKNKSEIRFHPPVDKLVGANVIPKLPNMQIFQ